MDREATSSLQILVVEDDADARANLRDILELDGHRIVSVGSAAEVLSRTDLKNFSAVILDRKLPDATAEELLPKIRQEAPGASLVIVTGYSDLQGVIAALRQGASDYILKPLNPDALRASLARIAERRRLTLAKEQSEAAFRKLVEAGECLIVIVRADRSILYFNPHAERVTGYTVEEVIADVAENRSSARGVSGSLYELIDRILSKERSVGDSRPFICRDGTPRWIVWKSQSLDDYDGAPAFLLVGQDITESKKAQDRALQAERLAAIGQMVTGLAHESRNALQRAQACLEMLALADRDRPRSLDLISRVQRAQDDLNHLFEDVRGYAAPIRLDCTPTDLPEIWRNAWTDLHFQRRDRHANIREYLPSENAICNIDRFRMGQVFRNLFDNALAACSDPVEITIRLELIDHETHGAFRITVRDSGPGLKAEQRLNLFEPFYTTKTKGTGLGLAITRRIVEAHGGRIDAGQPEGPGAEIILILPKEAT